MAYPATYAIRLDDVGGGVQYVGIAKPGTASATASWAIKKLTVTGSNVTVTWIDGDSNMDNIWDNRLAGTYT